MANRAYLYGLSNIPSAYSDRPESIVGLSEWPYAVPFSYRVLMSGEPQICASLLFDGFEDEPAESKTKLYAIASNFSVGFGRLTRVASILRPLVGASHALVDALDESLAFLGARQHSHLLLETVELDIMSCASAADLRSCVEREIIECRRVGAAIDALSGDHAEAGARLVNAALQCNPPPLEVFHGLRFDTDFDNVRGGNKKPLGLEWSEVLYYAPRNRADFGAGA
jgi:hypothetical protein